MQYFEILKKAEPNPRLESGKDGVETEPPSNSPHDRGENKYRTGVIHTAHGDVKTPAFLPIGTKGAVKAVTAEELKFWGADMILANTYHLWQRPGDALVYKAGGLHKFMNWKGPIFTDSGGFQVFSLAKTRKVMEAGVLFQFDLDGRQEMLSPEKSVQIQANLGSDICLILDDFPGYPWTYERSLESIELTNRWAERAIKEHKKILEFGDPINKGQKLWGIVQGASFADLREKSAKDMIALGFEGFAIGGVAVGEPHEEMMRAVEATIPHLPENAPKHLLGVGTPFDIVQAVARGCDTFDCVIPTREARHGRLYVNSKIKNQNSKLKTPPSLPLARGGDDADYPLKRGGSDENYPEPRGENGANYFLSEDGGVSKNSPPYQGGGGGGLNEGYQTINIFNEKFKEDFTPVDESCDCYLCLNHTKSYLRHLFQTGEPLAVRLATMHNLKFYLNLMAKIRKAIQYEYFDEMVEGYRELES